ncbi:hypothetical protein RRG08_037599 [Elysia crispata]|uniref:Uncharacterized protein n=1 Tax=Elysia crispata TaxID=231223 RepID=A0AAE0YGW2_9GAST|nr:hypothetical protein RRG08_037599 [Elysia crispata]
MELETDDLLQRHLRTKKMINTSHPFDNNCEQNKDNLATFSSYKYKFEDRAAEKVSSSDQNYDDHDSVSLNFSDDFDNNSADLKNLETKVNFGNFTSNIGKPDAERLKCR